MDWYSFLLGLMFGEFVWVGITIWQTEKRLRRFIKQFYE